MPRIPFPEGLKEVENLPRTRRALTNCFNNLEGQIVSRPGITQLNTTSKVARGQFVWNGSLYQVVSNSLIKITNTTTGAFSTIGTIAGSANIDTAVGFNTAVIVVKGANIYTLDKSDVLAIISGGANFVPCDFVAHINGRFIYIPTSGDPAFFSDVGAAATVQVTSFFDAEELPDENSSCWNLRNTLYIAGTDSIELFRDSTNVTTPFRRVSGGRIDNGFIGGLIEYNETFLFIGREKNQGPGIYGIGSGRAPKISNEAIDLILSTYTEDELKLAIGGRVKWRGYDIATFTLKRHSFGFFGTKWFVLDMLDGNGLSFPWGGGFITQFEGEYYTAFEDKIGKFALVNNDYGDKITRTIETAFEQADNDWFTCQSVELGISQGFNASVGTVSLEMSRDNVTYGDPVFRALGALGEYDEHLDWNPVGGLGMYNGFMAMRLRTTQDVSFSTSHLVANFRG